MCYKVISLHAFSGFYHSWGTLTSLSWSPVTCRISSELAVSSMHNNTSLSGQVWQPQPGTWCNSAATPAAGWAAVNPVQHTAEARASYRCQLEDIANGSQETVELQAQALTQHAQQQLGEQPGFRLTQTHAQHRAELITCSGNWSTPCQSSLQPYHAMKTLRTSCTLLMSFENAICLTRKSQTMQIMASC